jgi:hypothetical protein
MSDRCIDAVPGVEVLVFHAPPGSGKTTLSKAIVEILRLADPPNAAIDLDDLSKVFHVRDVPSRSKLASDLAELRCRSATQVVIPSWGSVRQDT